MSIENDTNTSVDLIRLAVLMNITDWLKEQSLEDITQIEDEYILRQMAKYNCFSRDDVNDLITKISLTLEKHRDSKD